MWRADRGSSGQNKREGAGAFSVTVEAKEKGPILV